MKKINHNTIFVIDDDVSLAKGIAKGLALDGYQCEVFYNAEDAMKLLATRLPSAIVSDIQLPGVDGINLVEEVSEEHPNLPIILTTAFGSTDVAIEATRAGAYDFLEKPFKIEALSNLLGKALASVTISRTKIDLQSTASSRHHAIIGNSVAMREICKTIGRVAATDMSVLIGGETGTGKELIAQALFHYSKRSQQPFLTVNCLAIPDNLIESELFGHEKGAFTGAHMRRIGRFEQVKNGTLFLDEIGDLPMPTQGKLLRVLQEGVIQRIGNNIDLPINTRVIAATHRNLQEAIHNGTFREDLYYRLSTMEIKVPALRDRPDDIRDLSEYFLARYSEQFGTMAPPLSKQALNTLTKHSWPGNVRELQNVIQKAIIEARGLPITGEIAKSCFIQNTGISSSQTLDEWINARLEKPSDTLMKDLIDELEARILEISLRRVGWNKKELADFLGFSRPAIYQKLKRHKLFAGKDEG